MTLYLISFPEWEQGEKSCIYAILQGSLSISDAIRNLAKLPKKMDGAKLFKTAFNISNPRIKINNLSTPNEEKEQKRFIKTLICYYTKYRNPRTHELRYKRAIDRKKYALDVLTKFSEIHYYLDNAIVCASETI